MPAENDDLVGPDPITQVFDSPEYGMHTALWWNVGDGSIPDLELVRDMGFSWVKAKIRLARHRKY